MEYDMRCDNGSHTKKLYHHIWSSLSPRAFRVHTHVCQVGTSLNPLLPVNPFKPN